MTKSCPFEDPEFHIDLGVPCPVCGCKGGDPDEVERLCVDGLIQVSKLKEPDRESRYAGGLTDEDLGVDGFGP